MNCCCNIQDKKNGTIPEQEFTEEQFFEQFAALEEGLALVQTQLRGLSENAETLRRSRQAHAAINLPCDTLAKVGRKAGCYPARLIQDQETTEADWLDPPQTASVQLSENASADVENGRPSRSRGQDRPVASTPLRTRRVPSAGISTVHTP